MRTHEDTCETVTSAADAILAQCESLLLELPNTVYCAESMTIRGGTIGKHLRHTLDHFAAATQDGAEVIDYDHRERDVPLETDRAAAMQTVAGLRARMQSLAMTPAATAVRIRVMVCSDGRCAELTSTLAREIAFATHHAIHHQAMMRAIAGEFGIDVNEGFGKAPSTLNHEQHRSR